MPKLHFGWFTPPLGITETGSVPLAIWQQPDLLPVIARHVDSLWLPDHLRPLVDPGVTRFILDCGRVATTDLISRFADQVIAPLKEATYVN